MQRLISEQNSWELSGHNEVRRLFMWQQLYSI